MVLTISTLSRFESKKNTFLNKRFAQKRFRKYFNLELSHQNKATKTKKEKKKIINDSQKQEKKTFKKSSLWSNKFRSKHFNNNNNINTFLFPETTLLFLQIKKNFNLLKKSKLGNQTITPQEIYKFLHQNLIPFYGKTPQIENKIEYKISSLVTWKLFSTCSNTKELRWTCYFNSISKNLVKTTKDESSTSAEIKEI